MDSTVSVRLEKGVWRDDPEGRATLHEQIERSLDDSFAYTEGDLVKVTVDVEVPAENLQEYELCYVEGSGYLYFTDDLDAVWGDEWGDVPYEHNALPPYRGDGYPSLFTANMDSFLVPPGMNLESGEQYSSYSVEMINNGEVPWLASSRHFPDDTGTEILAGTTFREVKEILRSRGQGEWIKFDEFLEDRW